MSEPFLAEIRIVGFNFAPRGWAFCDGQILPINQNQSLYSLLGTTFGGDGRTSFALPDMRGRAPIHVGASNGVNHGLGQKSGSERVTLDQSQIPLHNHGLRGDNSTANQGGSSGNLSGETPTGVGNVYSNATDALDASFNALAISSVGGGQGHDNMQPFLAINFCIALRGLFPSRN